MDNQEVIRKIGEFCESSFVEVFQNQNCFVYGCEAVSAIPNEDRVLIEAVASEVRMVLVLSIPRALLVASYPMQDEIEAIDDDKLADWYLELANRLLGSLKNKVVVGTSTMCLGIPSFKSLGELNSLWDSPINREVLFFEYEGLNVACELGVQVTGHIESLEQDEMASVDGELELF